MPAILGFRPTHVLVDGPYAESDGEREIPQWPVVLADDEGNEHVSCVCGSQETALVWGRELAKKHQVEFINESTPD